MRTIQGRWPPQLVNLQDFFRDINPALRGDFLFDEPHRKKRQQVVRGHRLQSPGMNDRCHLSRHVRDDIVPLPGHLIFAEKKFTLHEVSP